MNSRTLKIEGVGDYWRGKVKPKIRLSGNWLERAGFKAGNHVSVTCVTSGVIELRSGENTLALHEMDSQSHTGQ